MGRIGISYQDVSTAILKLQAGGKAPTVDNIRGVLKTGSKSTIARLLREWKQKQGLLPPYDGNLPTELLTILKELWLKVQSRTEVAVDNQPNHQSSLQQLHLEYARIIEQQRADYEQKLLQMQQQTELMTLEFKTHCAALEKEQALLIAKHTPLELQTQELQKKLRKSELDCARISQNYARMSKDFNGQRQALETQKNALIECQLRLGMASDHVDYLQNTLFATEDKLIALQDNYRFILQEKAKLDERILRSSHDTQRID